jgi:ubiquinone/menaquinone biosynthesis C-methylase UbiE
VTEASPWERAYQRFETPEQERRKFIRRLRRLGVERWSRDASVLEICSGHGNGLIAWQRLGFANVSGVDLSLALIERSACRQRCVVGDARRLPVRTASRDVAVVQGGLHHLLSLDEVREALAEMHRVLRPDGRVIIIEPWSTPFLRLVHLVAERKLVRALSNTLDAFAAMTDEERPTYEAWLARPRPIFAAVTAEFEGILIRRRFGKLVFLGRPLPRPERTTGAARVR